MKKYFRFLVIFLVLGCWLPHIATAQVVNVPDSNLAEALRGVLRLAPNAPITRQDLQRLGGFTAIDTQIRNLTGLEHATQLERLDLRSNQISNITPLARLAQLEVLILANNQISNITALAGLTRLRVLALDGNRVSDLATLARLTQLERLFIVENQVSNITPLTRLTQLERLDLWNNRISDVRPLAGLTQLRWLDLDGNQISDVRPLAGLTQLDVLYLHGNQIRDIRPLRELTQLKELAIGSNQIRDVSPLTGLTQLVGLGLSNNQIQNIRPLDRLRGLRQLFLSLNQISNVSPLAGLTRLQELWLAENNISDVSPLAKLVNLEKLRLIGNPVTDTSPLASLTKLVDVDVRITAPPPVSKGVVPDANLAAAVRETLGLAPNAPITRQNMQSLTTLDAGARQITNLVGLEHATRLFALALDENRIRDVRPLSGLTQLSILSLSNNQIRDVSPLAGLTGLMTLFLWNNQISDVSPLAALANLTELYLAGNPIEDTSPLASLTNLVEVDVEITIPPLLPDANLAAAVRETLGLTPNADITEQTMQRLTRLSANNRQIMNLIGLEHATQLTVLSLDDNRIEDLRPLAGLTQLASLSLRRNLIRDVSSLSGLTQLEVLYLGGNRISDVSPLAALTRLKELQLSWNSIRDVSPLAGLVNLEKLWLAQNPIQDTAPLASLMRLVTADIEVPTPLRPTNVETPMPSPDPVGMQSISYGDDADVSQLYWLNADRHQISRMPLDSITLGNIEIILSGLEEWPISIAFDAVNRQMYWTQQTTGRGHILLRANLDGTERQSIIINPNGLDGFTLDSTGRKMYWSERTSVQGQRDPLLPSPFLIQRANLDGTNRETIVVRQPESLGESGGPQEIAVDPAGGKLYWRVNQTVYRANLNGTNIEVIFSGWVSNGGLHAFALDTVNRKLYTTGENLIRRANLDGTNVEIIATGLGRPVELVLDVAGGNIYWLEFSFPQAGGRQFKIRRANLDGGNIQTLISGGSELITDIALGPPPDSSKATRVISDPNLAATVREALRLAPNAPITKQAMQRLTVLSADKRQVTNLTGLEHATQLETLHLGGNRISNVSSLAGLTQLVWLNLSWNQISDISPLAELTQLEDLFLHENQIRDVEPLAGLVNVKQLQLSGNPIQDTSPLASLTKLVDVDVEITAPSKILIPDANLATAVREALELAPDASITDQAMRELTRLDANNREITDLTGLEHATQLEWLNLISNELSDVSPLAESAQLEQLGLSNNELSDVSPLIGLTQLEVLHLNNNELSSVSPLAALTQLRVLGLAQNEIRDVSPLAGLVNLERLRLSGNSIEDTTPLASLTKLVELDIAIDASDTTVSLAPAQVPSPAVGEQLTLSLSITNGENVAGYQATLSYDTSALRYVSGANGDYLPAGAFFVEPKVEGNLVKLNAVSLAGESNGDGIFATLTFEVITPKASTLMLSDVLLSNSVGKKSLPQVENGQVTVPSLNVDVNGDGSVDLQDLAIVNARLNQTGENSADVNGDGVVDVADLALVAGAIGNGAAAPPLQPQALALFTVADVKLWLSQAQRLDLTDTVSQRGIFFLEQLLASLIPKETALLPNYPNPFNPETWIPYQLAEPANVTLTIYAMNGQVVRQLALGHQAAGVYHNRSRAAYWDGKNAFGEPVASGLYFYAFTAGDFTATRKMLIRQ